MIVQRTRRRYVGCLLTGTVLSVTVGQPLCSFGQQVERVALHCAYDDFDVFVVRDSTHRLRSSEMRAVGI